MEGPATQLDADDLTVRLTFDGPLDWNAMLAFLRARAIPGVEQVTDAAYWRTVVMDGRQGVIALMRGGVDHLILRVSPSPRVSPSDSNRLPAVIRRTRRIFALDAPVGEALEHLAGDPIIGALITARPGLRVPGAFDAFEVSVRAIIGQQVSVAGASTIIGRLADRFGEPLGSTVERPGLSYTFPAPESLAESDLNGLGMPGARAQAIQRFASAVATGEIQLDGATTLERLVESITRVRGLGPWTAHYIALRLGQRDAFPATDLGLRHALERLSPGSSAGLDKLAQRWSPWRATAAIQLWNAH